MHTPFSFHHLLYPGTNSLYASHRKTSTRAHEYNKVIVYSLHEYAVTSQLVYLIIMLLITVLLLFTVLQLVGYKMMIPLIRHVLLE